MAYCAATLARQVQQGARAWRAYACSPAQTWIPVCAQSRLQRSARSDAYMRQAACPALTLILLRCTMREPLLHVLGRPASDTHHTSHRRLAQTQTEA
jgi:hypothetical protein